MTDLRSRIIGYGTLPVDEALIHPDQFRIHPRAQQEALATVLDKVGWVQNVIVSRRTGYILDGVCRLTVAERRGETEIPCVYVDVTPDEERVILASIDAIGALAVPDKEKLSELIASVETEEADVLAMLAAVTEGDRMPPVEDAMPAFGEIDADEARRLDQRKPVVCPECGHEFTI